MTANHFYTLAGSVAGTPGVSGDGGIANSALTECPDERRHRFLRQRVHRRHRQQPGPGSPGRYRARDDAGDMYTVAGSAGGTAAAPATAAAATRPCSTHPASPQMPAGDLYIADSGNQRVQEVLPAAAGAQWGQPHDRRRHLHHRRQCHAFPAASGDNGPATQALLNFPTQIAIDSAGDLYIADTRTTGYRKSPPPVAPSGGRQMTTGDIYTVAGSATGAFGSGGLGGPATVRDSFHVRRRRRPGRRPVHPRLARDTEVREVISTASTPRSASARPATASRSPRPMARRSPSILWPPDRAPGPYINAAASGQYCLLLNTSRHPLISPAAATPSHPRPGDSYTYSSSGELLSETDPPAKP